MLLSRSRDAPSFAFASATNECGTVIVIVGGVSGVVEAEFCVTDFGGFGDVPWLR